LSILKILHWGFWLAQSVKHAALDLGVVSSSPTLDVRFTLKKIMFFLSGWEKNKEQLNLLNKRINKGKKTVLISRFLLKERE